MRFSTKTTEKTAGRLLMKYIHGSNYPPFSFNRNSAPQLPDMSPRWSQREGHFQKHGIQNSKYMGDKFQKQQLSFSCPLIDIWSSPQSAWRSLAVPFGNDTWPTLTSRLEPGMCSDWLSGNIHLSWTEMVVLFSWQILKEKAGVDTSQSGSFTLAYRDLSLSC